METDGFYYIGYFGVVGCLPDYNTGICMSALEAAEQLTAVFTELEDQDLQELTESLWLASDRLESLGLGSIDTMYIERYTMADLFDLGFMNEEGEIMDLDW